MGSPEIVELNCDRRGEPFELAGGTCWTDTGYGVSCHSESVAFTLDFSPVHDSADAADYRSRVTDAESASMWQSLSFKADYKAAYCMAVCPAGEA